MRLRNLTLTICAVLALASFVHADALTIGPTSAYYLNDYATSTIYVVQGAAGVINSFTYAYGAAVGGTGNYQEGMLAVTSTGGVSTNAFYTENVSGGIGGQYTLAGVPTGVQYPAPAGTYTGANYDATSDGTYNYYLEDGTPSQVMRTGLDWSDPTLMFVIPPSFLGIAYDATNNSLWVSAYGTIPGQISDYALDGTLLSTFVTGNGLTALAYDPADNTLWASVNQQTTLVQYDTNGNQLQVGIPVGLPGGLILSGEFVEGADVPGVPEPATLLLTGSGLLVLARRLRSRRVAQVASR